jgi:hypothetical protein
VVEKIGGAARFARCLLLSSRDSCVVTPLLLSRGAAAMRSGGRPPAPWIMRICDAKEMQRQSPGEGEGGESAAAFQLPAAADAGSRSVPPAARVHCGTNMLDFSDQRSFEFVFWPQRFSAFCYYSSVMCCVCELSAYSARLALRASKTSCACLCEFIYPHTELYTLTGSPARKCCVCDCTAWKT